MGQDTLPNRSDGTTIFADHVNVYKRALLQDIVPRDASGVATDVGGSLGTSTLRWLAAHLQTLYLYAGTRFTAIQRASGGSDYTLTLPNATPSANRYAQVDASGNVEFTFSPTVFSSDITSVSGAGGPNPVTSLNITTNGRPVMLGLTSKATHDLAQAVFCEETAGGDDIGVQLIWKRDGDIIGSNTYTANNMGTNPSFSLPLSMFWHIDDGAAAGAHTYSLEIVSVTAGKASDVRNCRMFAYEF